MTDTALARRIKIHVNAKPHDFFAVCQPGFEDIAHGELIRLGITAGEKTHGGIAFTAHLDECMRVNYLSRTATRVLMRLDAFSCENERRLKRKLLAFPWELYIAHSASLSFSVSTHGSRLYHTGLIEETCSSAIRERLIEYDITLAETSENMQCVFVRFENDVCTISLDTSGEPLYKRGYKKLVSAAPLRETAAASILFAARAENYSHIIDPMCGSGTFSIEAASIFSARAAGALRKFSFEGWPEFRHAAFDHLKRTCSVLKECTCSFYAADLDAAIIECARTNAETAGVADLIHFAAKDFFTCAPPAAQSGKTLIVLNPPYGERLGKEREMLQVYKRIGMHIREAYPDAGYAVIVPGENFEAALALPYDQKLAFSHGGIRAAVLIHNTL